MGGSSKSSQSSQSQTSYDPQLKGAFLDNYAHAQQVAGQNPGGQAYTGPLSADFSKTSLPQAVSGATQLGSYQAPTISAGQLANTDLTPYLNPFTSDVINTTAGDLSRQYGIDSTNANAQATQAGAFGGSRSAVLSGLVNDNYQRNLNTTLANLRQSGFTNAQQAAQQDITGRLSADTANQNANLQAAGVRAGAVGQLGQFGLAQQQQQQSALQAAYNEWLRQQQQPFLIQQMLTQAAGALPNGTVGTANSQGSSSEWHISPPNVSIAAGG